MKETYLTPANIDERASEMLDHIRKFNTHRREWDLKKHHLALMVTDMQGYFLSPSSHAYIPSAPAMLPNILALVDICMDKKIPVIYTRHINNKKNAAMMSHWWKDLIRDGSPESEIIDAFPDAIFFDKPQYDAFYETHLQKILQQLDVNQLIITGVMTNLCCETTARSAFIRGFEVLMPADATAAYCYDYHLGSLLNLSVGFAHITRTRDLIERLGDWAM